MTNRSDPADSLHDLLGITGITAFHDQLQTSEHHAHGFGVDYHAAFNFHLYPKVTFDASYGINFYGLCH